MVQYLLHILEWNGNYFYITVPTLQWLISMVDEKTNPNYVSLLKYVIYYIMSAEGTNNVIYYVQEQGQVIWMSFFIHHTNIIAINNKII